MSEREIRYCTTADGVSIAYVDAGQGYPFVSLTWLRSAATAINDADVENASTFTRFGFREISFDLRGMGASQRGVQEVSLETQMLDLEAVVAHAGIRRFLVHATRPLTPLAIAYAARHPERVSRMILMAPFASGERIRALSRFTAALAGVRASGDMVAYAAFVASLSEMPVAPVLEQIAPAMIAAYEDARDQTDVSDLLAQVVAPTLVIFPTTFDQRALASEVAAGIPDARFATVEGGRISEQVGLMRDFFQSSRRGAADAPVEPAPAVAGPFRTVLFTDIVGHTEMMQRLGDAKGREVLREHEHITRDLLRQHGGAEVKTMGDGFMASFGSVTKAIDCAIALQRAFASYTESMPEPLRVRVGLNAGEPIEEDGDLFGATVILASRIAAKAGGGEILIPEPLRHLLSGKSYVYADRGETMLKGFEDGVRLYEVRWQE